jgi:hypothetical protein
VDEFDRDRRGPGQGNAEEPYRVGNKRPPLHTRFKPGVSGNPRGRPKRHAPFDETLLKEFHKVVSVLLAGKPTKIANDKLFAKRIVKDGLTRGPQSARLLHSMVREAEAEAEAKRVEAEEREARQRKEPAPFSWSEEQERLYAELEEAGRLFKSSTLETTGRPTNPLDDGDLLK